MAAAAVSRKKTGQPACSATTPAGAERIERLMAYTPESRAYWVAEKRGLHRPISRATNTAPTMPPVRFSRLTAVISPAKPPPNWARAQ